MKIKQGAIVDNKLAIMMALCTVDPILKKYGQEIIVTEHKGGKHMPTSRHYYDAAVDLRIWDLTEKEKCVLEMRGAIGSEYDVVLESDHIHLEYDPK